jgi:hypothetical protein
VTFRCLWLALPCDKVEVKTAEKNRFEKLTRLKSPFGRLLHLFLVPEWDLSLGYCSSAEVVNERVAASVDSN